MNDKKVDDSLIEKRQSNVINVSNCCNQKCIFCSGFPKDDIDLGEVKRIIDSSGKEVFFQGGEPTLQKELFDLIRYAKSKGKRVTLVTNGLLLSYKNYVKKLYLAGLDRVFFAFHASEQKLQDELSQCPSYQYKVKALDNIMSLKKGKSVRIVYVINNKNYSDLSNFAFLFQKGILI
jgi:MoaA/NifB/PqqE/SkfB family radical SAM enzyme